MSRKVPRTPGTTWRPLGLGGVLRHVGRQWSALTRPGDDRLVRAAHARFVETGVPVAAVRPEVALSWSRSGAARVDADGLAGPGGVEDGQHPLRDTLPLVREVLTDAVDSAGCLWALSDARGLLL